MILGALILSLYGCGSDASRNPGAAGTGNVGDAGAGNIGAAGNGNGAAGSDDHGGAGSDGSGTGECSAAREQLLGAVDSVSTGEVTVLATEDDVTSLYIDATAGGTAAAASNPWIFVSLADSERVDVTDVTSTESTAWDLALKRALLYTNSGEAGPGQGGAALIDKEFADVSADDARDAEFSTEKFFDAECNPTLDVTGAASTSFSTWYDYDSESHALSPHPGTWLVHGGTGKLYKLRITNYYGTSDGGTGMAGGAYLIDVAAL